MTAPSDRRPAAERSLPVRWLIFTAGLTILAFGIAMSIRAGLGTSPISSFPAVMGLATPWSVGTWTAIMNIAFVALQIVLLRRDYDPFQLLQIPIAVVFGFLTDWFLEFLSWIEPTSYPVQWFWTILAGILVGTGVFVQVAPRIVYTAGEGLVMTLARVTKVKFSTVKWMFDWSLVAIAVVCSLALLGRVEGVREGTLAAAFLVGATVKAWARLVGDGRT